MSSGENREPTEAELAEYSRDELVRLGGQLDGVEVVHNPDPWPVPGTRAEKRAERRTALWFTLSALAGLAFLGVFIWWPWQYRAPGQSGYFLYTLYTPLVGATLGCAVLFLAVGALYYVKKFLPHEVSVQERHDGPDTPAAQQTLLAQLADAGARSTIGRRSMIKRAAGAAAAVFGAGLVVLPVGGLVRNPWKDPNSEDSLWRTGWHSPNGETVYLRRNTGNPHEIVKIRPEDLDVGGFETVFPFRESERNNPEALSAAFTRSDNPVMLIRVRPGQEVVKRAGQEDFNYGDFYAYSKICTHLGCPTSLYEQQTGRLLCPCHQSQFDVFHYAKPVFGPATRSLPQLPITVDADGYFVARGDFIEPVGPAFWERKS